MERITSRKNKHIAHLRRLSQDGAYRRSCGETVCAGEKLLGEALASGMEVSSVLSVSGTESLAGKAVLYLAPQELVDYASPLVGGPGPVFTLRLPERGEGAAIGSAVVLENVQDPGNVGTIIRSADALGIDAVICVGGCADIWSPKTVRAAMGAVFRQQVIEADFLNLAGILSEHGLKLYGAALGEGAADIRDVSLEKAAVAVGNEGSGLSEALLALCERRVIIPMSERSESLNAAMAATIIMWEMARSAR